MRVPGVGLPSLIVVTGRPAAGKSSLAYALARAIRCPVVSRDEIKEGLLNTIGDAGHASDAGDAGDAGDDVAGMVYDVFFETIERLLRRRVTLVAEAAFQHQRWAPRLEPLRPIARIRIVVCDLDARLARSRRVERDLADPARQRFHPDAAVQAAKQGIELPLGEYVPPSLDVPTLTVDTSGGYRPDLETIVSFLTARQG